MGYKFAGFKVIGNNEIDSKINAMYVKNHRPKYNFNCDIRDLTNLSLPDEIYNIDILDGSPPCSVFSIAGQREKKLGEWKKHLKKVRKNNDLMICFSILLIWRKI